MVDIERKKLEKQLKINLIRFTIIMLLATAVLYFIHKYIPKGIITGSWIVNWYPIIYTFIWGITMGALLIYGAHTIGSPIHHIFKRTLASHAIPLSSAISDTIIVSLSLVFADQFKRILEKIGTTSIHASLTEQLIGFITGRVLIILVTMAWIRTHEQNLYF